MTRDDIILAVKARLDELTPQEGAVALDEDALVKPVAQYVNSFLDEATDTVRLLAPVRRTAAVDFPTEDEEGESLLEEEKLGDGVTVYYRLPVPKDFLKVAEVRMDNWNRPCFVALPAEGEDYRLLRNPYTTAGPAKPAVVVADGYLELYGSRVEGVELVAGRYIDNRKYDDTDNMGQNALVDTAVMWRCALLVLGAMGRSDVVKQVEAFWMEAVRAMLS
jgi:hypothetical protein